MSKKQLPSVLVACPNSEQKEYCFDEWIDNVSKFTYPNFAVFIADNSNTPAFAERMAYKGISTVWVEKGTLSKMERFATSHDLCRQYALDYNFDYLLHLESDMFPPHDVIERLIHARKSIVGGIYHIGMGDVTQVMVQLQLPTDDENLVMTVPIEYQLPKWLDGTVKPVFHIGLGCMLIHKSVLKRFVFRCEKDKPSFHPDVFFAKDLFDMGFQIYADTSLICRHKNSHHKIEEFVR